MAVHQITVAKCTEEEVAQLQEFLRNLADILDENEPYDTTAANNEIADFARQLPRRAAWLAPLNLHILLDNYQEKESPILAHAKWISDLVAIANETDTYLAALHQSGKLDAAGIELHNKIKSALKED